MKGLVGVDNKYDLCELGIVETANQLVIKLVAQDLPDDYKPSKGWSYLEEVAWIRHNYTNYEEMLWELPLCFEYWDNGGNCPHDYESGFNCPLYDKAHDILKWRAKELAAEISQKWLDR